VKLTFSHGASLPDPDKLFNAGLEGNARRAIDFFEGDRINARALKNLVRAAVDYNQIKLKKKATAGTRAKLRKSKKTRSHGFFSLIVSPTRVRRFAGVRWKTSGMPRASLRHLLCRVLVLSIRS
jgi:hypothetical protein